MNKLIFFFIFLHLTITLHIRTKHSSKKERKLSLDDAKVDVRATLD